jgi:S-adenosylmethionine decarboxylase
MIETFDVTNKEVDVNIYNYKKWVPETLPEVLRTQFEAALKTVGYTIINHMEYHFPVKGYTCLWLLAESHLAIHTFPEKNTSYIELSGCNKKMNFAFEEIINEIYPNG